MNLVNEAPWDRIVRGLLGLAALAVWWTSTVTGGLGWVALVVGVILLLTGVVGWCPMYSAFGFATRRRERTPGA
ncbi:MAG TPA: DUF2892 domain-containing protein [Vicinamibacterales bacterium]|nr:DUF2892 domain-containing protein [Vicinamibacterales bacterium]